MLVLGLDPGSRGALVTIDERGRIKHTYVFNGNSREEMFLDYVKYLKGIARPIRAYVENVHAIQGSAAQSTFNFGRNFQLAIDGLLLLGIPIEYVVPRVWQKVMFEGAPMYIKKGTKNKRDNKRIAMEQALKLFNAGVFLRSERCSVPHDGLIDAALIAMYGLKKEQGEIE